MIYVCDAIMGSGKTSAAITYMNKHTERKFIYITPYLDEVDRIKDACAGFIAPSQGIEECGFTKLGHSRKLLSEGRNVVTTHQAFSFYTQDVLETIKEQHYTLIVDESLNALGATETNARDLEVLERGGYIKADGNSYKIGDIEYCGDKFKEDFRYLKSRTLVKNEVTDDDETAFFWLLPPDLINAFDDVFMLTYLFEAQEICFFLKMYRMAYEKIGVCRTEDGGYDFGEIRAYIPEYTKTLGDHIHICDHKKLNAVGNNKNALSKNWLRKKGNTEKLKNDIYNYFQNIITGRGVGERMWSSYECAETALRGKGYSTAFTKFNERATNKYRQRTVLVYAVNVYMNTGRKLFFYKHGVKVDEDMLALSYLVQWIWRSAIRDGKDIWIYIPSRRMREILINWIQKVEKGELV